MIVEETKCAMYFRFEDCEGNSIVKDVKLPWDTTWARVVYEVALALEGSGYINVVDRIKVRNVEHELDSSEPKYIPLKDEIDRSYF